MNLKNTNLVSFDEDDNEEINFKIKPTHELVKNDPRLVNKTIINMNEFKIKQLKENNKKLNQVKEKIRYIEDKTNEEGQNNKDEGDDEERFVQKAITKTEVIRENAISEHTHSEHSKSDKNHSAVSDSESEGSENFNPINKEELDNYTESKDEINNLKKQIKDIKNKKNIKEVNVDSNIKKHSTLFKYQEKYLKNKRNRMKGRETLEKLETFKEKLYKTI